MFAFQMSGTRFLIQHRKGSCAVNLCFFRFSTLTPYIDLFLQDRRVREHSESDILDQLDLANQNMHSRARNSSCSIFALAARYKEYKIAKSILFQ